VEWPDRGQNYLPKPDLLLDFGEKGEVRFVGCYPTSPEGKCLAEIIAKAS
jgi:hypothetical protein